MTRVFLLAADTRAKGSSGVGRPCAKSGRQGRGRLAPGIACAPGALVSRGPGGRWWKMALDTKLVARSTLAKAQLPHLTGCSQTVPPPHALCHVISSLLLCAAQIHLFHAASPASTFSTAPAPLGAGQTPSVTLSVPGLSNTLGWEPHRGLAL